MEELEARFESGGLRLEGVLAVPEGTGPFPAVVICHPHPLYGGSMDNNVVNGVFDALAGAAFVALKFNFRGVGRSEGSYEGGRGEPEDVRAAISYVSRIKEVAPDKIGLAGYSAGAGFGIPVGVGDERVKALVAISPPFTMFDFGSLRNCAKPKLLISGAMDSFLPEKGFHELCQSIPGPKECESIAGADHFWWGYEIELAARVVSFFTTYLKS